MNKQWSEMETTEKAGYLIAIPLVMAGVLYIFSDSGASDRGPTPTDFVVEKEYVGCITEDLYDRAQGAASSKDMKSFRKMVYGGGCYPLQGRKVHVIDKGFTVSKVRADTSLGARQLYVPSQMLLDARK